MAFNTELQQYIDANEFGDASKLVLSELGKLMSKSKSEFIYLLNSSDVPATMSMTNEQLADAFVANAQGNKKLLVGAAYLVNHHNKQMGFDGDEEVNDVSTKNSYAVLYHQFEGAYLGVEGTDSEEQSNVAGESTAQGAASGGAVGAVAGAVSDLAKLGGQIHGQKNATKNTILAQRQAKSAMLQSAQESKQTTDLEKTKQRKYIVIGVVSILLVSAIGFAIYKFKKK